MHRLRSQKPEARSQKPKFLLFIFISAFCLLSSDLCYAQEKIVAVVNSEVITQRDLNDFAGFMRMQMAQKYQGKELENKLQTLKPELLGRLIEDRLILQEAKKQQILINEDRIKEKIKEIKSRYATDTEFQQEISAQGLVQADVEDKIREQLLMYAVIEQEVKRKIRVEPTEVTEYYQKNSGNFLTPERWEFESVMLESADLAKEIALKLKKKQDLVAVAQQYGLVTDEIIASKDGQLRKDIEDVVFKLSLHESSEPILVEDKYYIFTLREIIPPRQETLAETQERIYAIISDQKTEEAFQKWVKEVTGRAYIKILQ